MVPDLQTPKNWGSDPIQHRNDCRKLLDDGVISGETGNDA